MHEPVYQELVEAAMRRALTAEEQARLRSLFATRPEARAEWEADARLTQCLRSLPDAPLASNFTARVLQEVARIAAHRRRRRSPAWLHGLAWWVRGWRPAAAVLVLATALLGRHEYQLHARAQMARSVAALSPMVAVSDVGVWQDFDSINSLPPAPLRDADQLLAALK